MRLTPRERTLLLTLAERLELTPRTQYESDPIGVVARVLREMAKKDE